MLQTNTSHRSNNSILLSATYLNPESDLLAHYGIQFLYHITHINNLKSILQDGLLSHNKAHRNSNVTDISYQDVNARRSRKESVYGRSLHDYVPSFFVSKTPMSSALRSLSDDLVILQLSPELLLQPDMLFTDGNAACNRARFFNQLNNLDQLNWACLHGYWKAFDDGGHLRSAECLIPNNIPVSAIKRIATKNKSLCNKISAWIPMEIQATVQPELFF